MKVNRAPATRIKYTFLDALFLTGFLEFSLVAFLVLRIAPDPKSAFLFSYSISRLVLALIGFLLAGWFLLLLTWDAHRAGFVRLLEFVIQKWPIGGQLAILLLTLSALLVFVTPTEFLGRFGLYFERIRPLLFVFCFYPIQLSLNWWMKSRFEFERPLFRSALVALIALLVLVGWMYFSGLGLTPEDDHWNVAGVPLTMLQLILLFLLGGLFFGTWGLLKTQVFSRYGTQLDWLIILVLFLITIFLWVNAPASHNEFSSRPVPPYFQVFPVSDARVHDLGALAALNGFGILFRSYTDKPLYMVLLAVLHFFAHYDYNLLNLLHLSLMAGMVPSLYVFGKSFHSRFFGFLLAGVVLVRQQNAISLSKFLNFNTPPAQLMTEIPTLFGIILSAWVIFLWFKSVDYRAWRAFLAGGVLGAVSLIRLNPFLLIPALPFFLFLSMRTRKKAWFIQIISFTLGCVLLLVPWMLTGTNQAGQPWFILKFQDIISVRYGGALPVDTLLESSELADRNDKLAAYLPFPVLSAGPSLPNLDTHSFPGFVVNHTLHNFIGSFLTLPDSFSPANQLLDHLMARPYWSVGQERLEFEQIPFVLGNLCLLALGLGWSWRRWRWAGLVPLFVFVVYSISLGLGRTSGSRFLIPVDWLVDFYFVLGLLFLFQVLPRVFRQVLAAEPESETPESRKSVWELRGWVFLVVCLAALIPVFQTLIPLQKKLCAPIETAGLSPLLQLAGPGPKIEYVYGEVLYPEIEKDRLTFTLLTCQRTVFLSITNFSEKIAVGQRVIAVLDRSTPEPSLKFMALPPDSENPLRILWQAEAE